MVFLSLKNVFSEDIIRTASGGELGALDPDIEGGFPQTCLCMDSPVHDRQQTGIKTTIFKRLLILIFRAVRMNVRCSKYASTHA